MTRATLVVVTMLFVLPASALASQTPPALPLILSSQPADGPGCVTTDLETRQLIEEMRVARYTHVYWASHWKTYPLNTVRTRAQQHHWDILWVSIYDKTIKRLCLDVGGTLV